jgi:sec-independent protein translocase protein TatC|tara:strand:+ start:213 stop:917 length:705 start_codon:yes stop_codon:yes gene_type:complete
VVKKAAYDDIVDNLRNRFWIFLVISVLIFGLVFNFAPDIIGWLGDKLLPDDATLIYLSPAEYFLLKMRVAGYAAISIVSIGILLQSWHTIRKRTLLPDLGLGKLLLTLIISLTLFITGMLYSLELMLPTVLEYLQDDAASAGLETTYSLSAFYHFVFLLTFSLGITFQLPLVVMFILKLELATVEQLAEYRSHLVVVFFVLAAFITPPDVISQFLLALPLMVLYELSIVIGKVS